ncbi:Gfo/Idh/MocA family oxidoreductase [Synechococcus sp. Cruz-9H2]|uniref:Gfo/Idh/MocA family protein n=1 Tax=unclassified Synechococcus TaxID=2626047 RepID=UPI0020CCA57D|nr:MULTISPECIES: Gfo/Idh/MocA family oxidoreductase [unclassified Synechococcus]MCP9818441.1 Gfo/Idh/MocA family oxidoreductase [Synechococcus sp. Cruz-9H2]MCP9842670.1 Gfo/Idh/MocA family oxidoreductase [Synechococcus sp. Edmonson 11F2]MCP9855334.1 Gfo/Idh/MocA family oxidoreductase [Synechococcus sp. Cruz-9C9]MCP9862418.1 Gfo/Idh/MocA family oxidoreductase [Synechococcus sp. Cruz-7E5]MCP9869690.1 Gfo/Idh/MocA family oxidoreductase [Synechococcus sp. Cruz-7B9]
MSQPLQVALAGLGFGEKVHLPALRACPGTEPVALWHPRPERLEAACRAAELPGHSDFAALLADPAVEAVVIATPPGPRFELARAALEAGKHLLLEKPVALEVAQVRALRRLAIERGLSVAVDFEYRAVPVFQQLKALLTQGVLGDPWLVRFDWLMSSRADPGRAFSWASQRSEGGGVLGSLGTHAFDSLEWLVGPVRQLSASLSTAIHQRPLPATPERSGVVDADDVALLQLELETSTGASVPAQLSLSSVTRAGRGCWLEFHGSEATLILGSDNQADYVHGFHLWLARPGEALQPVPADPALAFGRTWADGRIAPVARLQGWWSDSVREGRPMMPGLAEGERSQLCCDLALESDASGMRQNLGS